MNFKDYKEYKKWFNECEEFLRNNCELGKEMWFYHGYRIYIKDEELATAFKLKFM